MISEENKKMMAGNPGLELYERWFTVARIIGVALVALVIVILYKNNLLSFDPHPVVYIIAPLYLLCSVIWFLLRKMRPVTSAQIYLELIFDLIAISAGIHYAGGTRGPFIFIYIATCITATAVSVPVTIFTSIFATISYLMLFYLEHSNIISALQLYNSSIQSGEILNGSVLLLMISIIAFQSSYYISRIKKEDQMMLDQEEELRKFKDDFLFKTVHDLRAPGTAIRLAIEELGETKAYACSTDATQTISIIQSLDQRMLNLVNDILKIGKSEQVEMEIKKEKVNIHEVVQEITKNLGPIATSKQETILHIDNANIPMIWGDKEKLIEVFSNLIDNAIKYNKDGGTINITHEIKGNFFEISISDQGVGIPEEDIGKLFAPYFRSGTGKSIQGTGLGLYIVKNLVEKMGGTIRVSSKVGAGTTFIVSLVIAS